MDFEGFVGIFGGFHGLLGVLRDVYSYLGFHQDSFCIFGVFSSSLKIPQTSTQIFMDPAGFPGIF